MIQTTRCLLKKINEENTDSIIDLFTHPTVRLFLGGPRSILATQQLMDEMLSAKPPHFYWSIYKLATHEFLGLVSISPHHHKDELEISYQFLPEWWGQGLATEVIQAVIHFAFEQQLATRLLAETQIANAASCRVLEKVGMFPVMEVERFGARQRIYKIESPHMPRQNKKDD